MASAGERLSTVMGHLNPSKASGKSKLLEKNPDDIVRKVREFIGFWLMHLGHHVSCENTSHQGAERRSQRHSFR